MRCINKSPQAALKEKGWSKRKKHTENGEIEKERVE
jgi:hypothetical protein